MAAKVNAGEPLPENAHVDLAYLFNENMISTESHKHVALIISNFTNEQLQEFSKLKED